MRLELKLFYIIPFLTLLLGILIGRTSNVANPYISNGMLYQEIRKRSLTQFEADYICKEAKEALFLYEQYGIKED